MTASGNGTDVARDDAAPPAKAGKRKMLLAGLALLVLGAGGGGTFLLTRDGPADEAPPLPIYVDVPPMVVNLEGDGSGARFLKARVVVAMKDEASADVLRGRMAEVNDHFISYFRELRVEDLAGSQGPFRVKEELMLRAADVAGRDNVRDVLIQELVQQ